MKQQTKTIYKEQRKPVFPLYICEYKENKKTVETILNYSKYNDNNPYKFYAKALLYHVAYATGLFNQFSVNQVIASAKDIRKLLPINLTLDKLLTLTNPSVSTHTITKENN